MSAPWSPGATSTSAPNSRQNWTAWAIWLGALGALTLIMFMLRPRLDKAHVALGFLVVVLGGSAAGGRLLGVTLALLAFFSFNFFFLPPYHSLVVADGRDWLVLGAFLITGIVAAQLLNRAQERAENARQRAIEVERLAALGAETLNAGRAEDALQEVLRVIQSTIGVSCCEILVPAGPAMELTTLARAGSCEAATGGREDANAAWSLAAWVVERRAAAGERVDGTKWVEGPDQADDLSRWPPEGTELRTILVPLVVRDRSVGVLRVAHTGPFLLNPDREQFLSALSYYAALGVERVRLVAEADRAEAFRQADSLKSALIAGVSHDLRTPLTTIKALAQTLRQRGNVEASSIEEEADRLNRLVADLLDLSRLNAGAMPVRLEINHGEDLVGAALQRVAGVINARRVISTHASENGDGGALVGRFDFVHALRALVNLLENADKYSPPNEPIDLTISRTGKRLEFSVADRGRGIVEAERERIFEPFYRAPGAPPDVGGAGLGLAIARRLAAEQGGELRYAERPGGGSVFTLSLPAADPPPVESD